MTGAGIMLIIGTAPSGSLCSSDDVSALMERLQFDLGEGPCIDAHSQRRPVLEPDLARPVLTRWVAFSEPALSAGARAVFGFPLRVGAVGLGALNLYRDQSGAMSDEQYSDALVAAGVAASTILMLQADAPPGSVAAELEEGADFRYVVHQASGMVAAQLGIGVGDALVRLRAYAFGHERPLADVARDVVARTLRFDGTTEQKDDGP